MKAMAEGVAALGGRVEVVSETASADDLMRLLSSARPRFAFTCGMHREAARPRGILAGFDVPLLVLDCGWFNRAEGGDDEEGYNQLGLGQLNWLPPRCHRSPRRWLAHGLTIAPRQARPGNKRLLVLGQVPNDSQHHLSVNGLASWLTERAAECYAQGWTILYRPHPRHVLTTLRIPHTVMDPAEPLANQLAGVAAALTFNSTAGLEALRAGVPVGCDSSAHYHRVAGITDPDELLAHCELLAAAQWTCAELRTGAPLRFMAQFSKRILP